MNKRMLQLVLGLLLALIIGAASADPASGHGGGLGKLPTSAQDLNA
jgi:hypothetical protein